MWRFADFLLSLFDFPFFTEWGLLLYTARGPPTAPVFGFYLVWLLCLSIGTISVVMCACSVRLGMRLMFLNPLFHFFTSFYHRLHIILSCTNLYILNCDIFSIDSLFVIYSSLIFYSSYIFFHHITIFSFIWVGILYLYF
jgi:hypothetical protein